MNILKLLIYYLGIQLVISTLLYFYYLMYWGEQCSRGDQPTIPSTTDKKENMRKIMKIFLYCAILAVLYHSYLDVKYRH